MAEAISVGRKLKGKGAPLPSETHAELVDSLFGTVSSFIAGIVGGLLVPIIAYFRTNEPTFLATILLMVALGAFRIVVYLRYKRSSDEDRRAKARQYERLYGLGAVGFMTAVGCTAALILVHQYDELTNLYGIVLALGCAGSLSGRNAGRPRIVNGQIWGICGPIAAVLIVGYDAWYWGLAAILGLILTSVKSTTHFLNGILVSALLNGREARIQRARFSTALNNMSHGLCMGGGDGSISVVNQRLREFFDLDQAADLNEHDLALRIASSGGMAPAARAAFLRSWKAILTGDGSASFSADIGGRIYNFRSEPESQGGFVVVVEDVTTAQLAARKIEHMAHFDTLTELPNRSQFYNQLISALDTLSTEEEQLVLLSIDLDQFKEVNDTRGHPVGDELLRAVAKRLRRSVKATDLLARFGGDEFQVLLRLPKRSNAAHKAARRIINDLSEIYLVEGQLISIGASIGMASAPRDCTTADALLRCADMALYAAKANGRGIARAFTPGMERALLRKCAVENAVRTALAEDTLELHYQPVFDCRTGKVIACEALVRMPHSAEGPISPAEFIPVAEETGLVVELGDWVLRRACSDAMDWPSDIRVAVNFSPKQFVLGGDIAASIADVLSETGLSPDRLEVEITEGTLIEAKNALQQVSAIARMGVKVALDDFGTGFSSLSYLRQFPVDKIKIDQSFAQNIESQASQAVIRSVSLLARLLDVDLVIEGVETAQQLEIIESWDIHLVQGYVFSRPMPLAELGAVFLRSLGFRAPRSALKSVA